MEDTLAVPDDLKACQQALIDMHRAFQESVTAHQSLAERHEQLLEELHLLKRFVYGPRRERYVEDPRQQHLFDQPPEEAPAPADVVIPEHTVKRRKGHGRQPLPKHLPRKRIEHDLPEDQKHCGCGREKTKIGEDLSEQLECVPASLHVLEHVYPKYACSCCKDGVASSAPVSQPIEKGLPGAGLLAYVIVSKYHDSLPLYRQQDILARQGVELSRSTLCGWMRYSAELLFPLYELLKRRVLSSAVLWTDDTPTPVLDPLQDKTRTGRFWAYLGDRENPYTVYDFTLSRRRDGPVEFLQGFKGYLHADAYGGYDGIYTGSSGTIQEVACWAHARRKFFDARHTAAAHAPAMLAMIGQLYEVEEHARALSVEDRQAMRQQQSVPVLDRIENWLAERAQSVLPKNVLGQAIGYARNQWEALRRYTADGRLTIDNNQSERTLRLQAIGRKNWLFLGSEQGGNTAKVLFSVLASAKRHYVEPWSYLRDVLNRLAESPDDLTPLLPDEWLQSHPDKRLEYRKRESEQARAAKRQRRNRRRQPLAR
jgi:transposase